MDPSIWIREPVQRFPIKQFLGLTTFTVMLMVMAPCLPTLVCPQSHHSLAMAEPKQRYLPDLTQISSSFDLGLVTRLVHLQTSITAADLLDPA